MGKELLPTTYICVYYVYMFQYFLKCQGKEIGWSHLVSLYEHNRSDAGLSLILKLKFEHIHLATFSKMRVDLAAQVQYLRVYIFSCYVAYTCACLIRISRICDNYVSFVKRHRLPY